jgi:hypothetical protein
MINKLAYRLVNFLLLVNIFNGKCLDNDALKNLGLTPVAAQTVSNPGVCKEILASAKLCVDLAQLKTFLEGNVAFQNSSIDAETNESIAALENVKSELKTLEEKPEEIDMLSGSGKDDDVVVNMEIIKDLNPDDNADLKDEAKGCKKSQNVKNVGTYCLLVSDRASEFVTDSKFYDGIEGNSGEVVIGESPYDRSYTVPITIRVLENSADKIVKGCGKSLKTKCVLKKALQIQAKTNLDVQIPDDVGCNGIKCAAEGNCSKAEKALIFQTKANEKIGKDLTMLKDLTEKQKSIKDSIKQKFPEDIAKVDEIKKKIEELIKQEKPENAQQIKDLKNEVKTISDKLKTSVQDLKEDLKKKDTDLVNKVNEIKDKVNNKPPPPKDSASADLNTKIDEIQNNLTAQGQKIKALLLEKKEKLDAVDNNEKLTAAERETQKKKIEEEYNLKIKAIKDQTKTVLEDIKKNYDNTQVKKDEEKKKADEERKKAEEEKKDTATDGSKPTDSTLPPKPTDSTLPPKPTDSTLPPKPTDSTLPPKPTDSTYYPEKPTDSTTTDSTTTTKKLLGVAVAANTTTKTGFAIGYLVDNSGYDIVAEGNNSGLSTSYSLISSLSIVFFIVNLI